MAEIGRALSELERMAAQYKKAIESLNESEESLELAISGSNGGLWYLSFDPERPDIIPDEIYISPALKRFIGYEDHEFPNSVKAWKERIIPEDLILVNKSAQEHLEGKRDIHKVEYRIYHKDGSIRWIHSRGKIMRDDQGRPKRWAGIDWDITARKKAEEDLKAGKERLQSLSKNLLNKLEAERRHMARELHDEIGQALTAIKINLQSLQRINDPTAFKKRLDDSIGIVERTLNQVRDLSLNLRPSLLDDIGLVPTIRWYADRLFKTTGIAIELKIDEIKKRPPLEIETACFRIVQEALNNIVRHAGAGKITIELRMMDGYLDLEVIDDGIGFDVRHAIEDAQMGKSLGILGMRERAELSGGEIVIESNAGGSTKVKARFPVDMDVQ